MITNPIWRSSISNPSKEKILVRGYNIVDLMDKYSFGDVAYLLFKGELPKGNEGKMLDAVFISSVEHSVLAPSTNVARFTASCGVPLQASVATGITALGDYHGGAIEQCAKMLQENIVEAKEKGFSETAERIVGEYKSAKKRILGFGHALHNPDPRTLRLFELAEKYGLQTDHIKLAQSIEKALKESSGRDLPCNVDGAIGAVMSDLELDWQIGKGLFIIARSVGLTAHVYEQMTKEKPFKIFTFDDIEYTGIPEREVPNENS